MTTELVSPEVESEVREVEEGDKTIKDVEQEIECPRCSDVMTLSSNFDRLGYVCQECDFLLFMK
jgi:ribosomal protein S27AE